MSRDEILARAAIKKYCKECSGDSETEASRCTAKGCPLWKYRCSSTLMKKAERELNKKERR